MNQRSLLNPRVLVALVVVILLVGLAAWMRQRDAAYPTTVVSTRPAAESRHQGPSPGQAVSRNPAPSPTQAAPSPAPSPVVVTTPRFTIDSAPRKDHMVISIGGPVTVQMPPFPDGMGVPEAPAELLDAAIRGIEIAGPGNAVTVVDSDHRYWIEFQIPATQRTVSLTILSDYLQLASGQDSVQVGIDPSTKVYEIPLTVAPRLPFSPPTDPAQTKAAWEDYLTEAFGIVVEAKSESPY